MLRKIGLLIVASSFLAFMTVPGIQILVQVGGS